MYPVFLVYNEGKLNAFGFTFYTESLSSPRFEEVTPDDLKVRVFSVIELLVGRPPIKIGL